MKKVYFILLAIAATKIFAGDDEKKYNQVHYLPGAVKEFYLGMPFSAFMELRSISEMDLGNNFAYIYLEYTEFPESREITSISYRFDMDYGDDKKTQPLPSSPLYEIQILYKRGINLDSLTEKLYGPPTDIYHPTDDYHLYDKQWTLKTQEDLTLLIRQTGNLLMIAGVIKGTEWSLD